MISPRLLSLPTRDAATPTELALLADVARLTRTIEELKQREKHYVRCISEMLNTPSTSVASAKFTDGQWQVVMTSGAVWQRVEKVIDTPDEYRYVETWVPRPAVPGTRAALQQQLDAALALCPKVA